MAVKLEQTIQRFIGLSTDIKPGEVVGGGTAPPPGSSFMETDSGLIYRYDGERWSAFVPEDDVAQLLQLLLEEVHQLRTFVELVSGA